MQATVNYLIRDGLNLYLLGQMCSTDLIYMDIVHVKHCGNCKLLSNLQIVQGKRQRSY